MSLAKPPLSPAAQLLRRAHANGAVPAIERSPFSVPAAPHPPSDIPSPTSEPLIWLWSQRLPRAHLTLLLGAPDSGKSFLALDLALRAAAGLPFPHSDVAPQAPADTFLLSAPHHAALTLRRLHHLGLPPAVLARLHHLPAPPHDSAGEPPASDLAPVRAAIKSTRNPALLIIDSLSSLLPRHAPLLSAPSHLRAAAEALSALAAEFNLAVLATVTLPTARPSAALDSAARTLALLPTVPTAFLLTPDHHAPHRRLLVPIRSALSERPRSLALRIIAAPASSSLNAPTPPRLSDSPAACVGWEDLAADSSSCPIEPAAPSSHRARSLRLACDWLRDRLAHGPIPAADLLDAARRDGLTHRTLERARATVGVHAFRHGKGIASGSLWLVALPEATTPAPIAAPLSQDSPLTASTPSRLNASEPKTANSAA